MEACSKGDFKYHQGLTPTITADLNSSQSQKKLPNGTVQYPNNQASILT